MRIPYPAKSRTALDFAGYGIRNTHSAPRRPETYHMEQNAPNYPPSGWARTMRPAPARRPFLADRHTTPQAMDLFIALGMAGLPAVVLGIVVARYGLSSPWVRALTALTIYLNCIVVLRGMRYGLALFIVAAGLSPKLPGFYDNMRVEDMVFVLV